MQNQCTSQGSCGTGSHSSQNDCSSSDQDLVAMLMKLAECAKKDLMKEKIAQRIEAKMGKKMDQVADLAADMFAKKMEMKMQICSGKEEAKQALADIMKS